MILYHGSVVAIDKPSLSYSRTNLDFGKGFYVTGLQGQAEKWAKRKVYSHTKFYGDSSLKPIVSVYEFTDAELSRLTFTGYTQEWLDFVVGNRSLSEVAEYRQYDIIFGNVADDDVAAVVDGYMSLLGKGRIDDAAKAFYISQLQYSKPNDQYCFSSDKALAALTFIRSYEVEG